MVYKVPDNYFFRLHHVRPRFKNNIEDVLIFIASEISKLDRMPKDDFRSELNQSIRRYPDNITKAEKTIDNWRTEISSLFGFVIQHEDSTSEPSIRALELAVDEDLVAFFKTFLYFFQYPGGHVKPKTIHDVVTAGISFKPLDYLLKLLRHARKSGEKYPGINKAEATHCIFNDLRVTRDKRNVEDTWQLIVDNRNMGIEYDWEGDVIRYAGDILDYMEIANLVRSHARFYYSNKLENQAIDWILKNPIFFTDYAKLDDLNAIGDTNFLWFDYVNQNLPENIFKTDILAYMSENEEEYQQRQDDAIFVSQDDEFDPRTTKDIGDRGEALVIAHEKMRVKIVGRSDLLHLIKHIPTHLALGYDVKSVEIDDGTHRFIEVKTTISNRSLDFSRFHLTTNEWLSAETHGSRYYVYRLMISKENKRLFILCDPVRLYKHDKIKMIPRNGAEIVFQKDSGEYVELLEWQND
ncbi:MAG: DUF3883 domain-containing protein [Anaerolineae bacterium]|nr:DUF3883 domain-containing protein [Anaerolineae bacterium]